MRFQKGHKFLGDLSKPNHFQKGQIPWNKGKKRPDMSGNKHHNWKGGIMKHERGYILIYSPSHPNCTKDGYIFEHRLVMEKHLGRILLPTEVVHHINSDTKDNRIENLMLFSNSGEHIKYHRKKRNEM